MNKLMFTVNIFPNLIMTETCNYKLYCNNHGNFFKINKNMQNLYFKIAAILDIVCQDLIFGFIYKNGVEDLKYTGPLIKVSITYGRK